MDQLDSNGKHYSLFTRDGTTRLVWRFADEGVMVEDDALRVMRSSRWVRIPFEAIVSITLSSNVVGRSAPIGQCTVQLSNGTRIIVGNGNDQGLADGRRDGPYRQFIADFHERLIESGDAPHIKLVTGFSKARIAVLVTALTAGAALFVALPLLLLVITRDLKTLGILVGGALLLWPALRIAKANQPGIYSPTNPPDFID